MHKKIFIVPYFGEFPNYFQLVLNSMKQNVDFDWLIFTDNKKKFNYPRNVKVINIEFNKLKDEIQNKFDFKISLEKPYKFCDFRPAYGYIFEEYIKDYDFWGYCDVDLIFGKLSNFITEDILTKYQKIFTMGHMTLYRNSYENNRVFMSKFKKEKFFEIYLSKAENFAFDELYEKGKGKYSINNIYESLNIEIYNKKPIADIYVYEQNFRLVKDYDRNDRGDLFEEKRKSIFTYENGKILRYYFKFNEFIVKEYMYIHLQKRKMTYKKEMEDFMIVPNSFIELKQKITKENFKKIRKQVIDLNHARHLIKIIKIELKFFILKKCPAKLKLIIKRILKK